MSARTQGIVYLECKERGWVGVSGPVSDKTPIGGPIYMMNDKQNLCRIMSDGTVEWPSSWDVFELEHQ